MQIKKSKNQKITARKRITSKGDPSPGEKQSAGDI